MKKKSDTHRVIYSVVRKIPKGKVATYGEVAELSGFFGQARLVGYALHNLPRNTRVPWHRVINSEGKISLSDLDGMYNLQKSLLRKEGVVFVKERVDFSKYGWIGKSNKRSMTYFKQLRRWRKSNIR
jgi:methylated-DNA-protein-cysteine methyltransferase-like protein